MEAKRFLERQEGTSFGPEALKVIGQAFDEAWSDIAGNFGDGAQIEGIRLRLAQAILSAANDTNRDVAALKRAGLLQRWRCAIGSVGSHPANDYRPLARKGGASR